MSVFFITGIDAKIGKTFATGYLAKQLMEHGINVITQKLIETGCENEISEDITAHRDLMKISLQPVDKQYISCPYVFKAAAPPYLAAELEHVTLYPNRISVATQQLKLQYEVVLLETSGGIMTPITDSLSTIDYMASQGHPIVLVTAATLESINHTLLALQAIAQRGLPLHAVIYNQFQEEDESFDEIATEEVLQDEKLYDKKFSYHRVKTELAEKTRSYLQHYLKQHHPDTFWVELPHIKFTDDATLYQKMNADKNNMPFYTMEKYAQEIADNTLYAESLYKRIAKK